MSSDQTIAPSNSSPNPDEIIPDPAPPNPDEIIPDPAPPNLDEIIPDPTQEDNNVVSTNQNEQTEVPDNNGNITIPPQPQQPEAVKPKSTHAHPQSPASSDHIPESKITTTNDSGLDKIIPDPTQENNNVVSTNQNEQKEVPDNNGSITIPPQPQQPEAVKPKSTHAHPQMSASSDHIPESKTTTINDSGPDEIIPDPAQEDNNVVSTNQNEQKEVPNNNSSIIIPPQPQQPEAVKPKSMHAHPQTPASSDHIPESKTTTTTNDSSPDKIISDPTQEANNVVSTNQNEQKVPDNNGSITIPPQPQQPEVVKPKSTLVNPQAPTSSKSKTTTTNDSGPGESTQALLNLISRELEYIKGTSKTLGDYKVLVGERIPSAEAKIAKFDSELKKVMNSVETAESDKEAHKKQIEEIQKELRQFKKHVRKLKLTIPPKFKINLADLPALEQHLSDSKKSVQPYTINDEPLSGKLELFKEKIKNEYRSAFQDFQERYAALDNKLKLCLLCFSVFPEDEKIKKRLMVYWWIGEGFITPLNEKEKEKERESEKELDLEQLGAKCFDELIKKEFIHSADGKGSQEVDNCKMQPFVRWAIILMAEKAKFFKFDDDGNPTEDYSSSFRACLVGKGLDIEKTPDLEKLHMLFNVNEDILDLKPEWFLKMKNVSVLCLGRWQAAAEHHIEVEETKFLEGLKNMIHLRYLSLQGISRITKLPNSVANLGKLTILDLRACHNLEEIPHDIGLLKRLTHLDLSECYLLAHMPRGLSQLANLLVLKGFLVTQDKTSCSLDALTKLTKLRKLSIFTGVMSFPESKDLEAFPNFKVLHKLKIVWGGGADKKGQEPVASNEKKKGKSEGESKEVAKQENHTVSSRAIDTQTPANVGDNRQNPTKSTPQSLARTSSKLKTALGLATEHGVQVNPGLPPQLEKLDLQCIPMESAPNWLQPTKLESLKKLYIRGGQLRDLNTKDQKWEVKPWSVERLRLKYLTGLGMNWTELLDLFPKLIYLEKVRCPKLTLFPCDVAGVWLNNKTKIQE